MKPPLAVGGCILPKAVETVSSGRDSREAAPAPETTLVRPIDIHRMNPKIVGPRARHCRDLGLITVAAGVETDGELDAIIDLGCDVVRCHSIAQAASGAFWSVLSEMPPQTGAR